MERRTGGPLPLANEANEWFVCVRETEGGVHRGGRRERCAGRAIGRLRLLLLLGARGCLGRTKYGKIGKEALRTCDKVRVMDTCS